MTRINENFMKLKAGYLFPEIARRTAQFREKNPDSEIIPLGIGDVVLPLPKTVIDALHAAVNDMAKSETFKGYGPGQGYEFLIDAIVENYRQNRNVKIDNAEVFVSDGSKCDTGNIQEIFADNNKIAVTDPVYQIGRAHV